MKYSLRSLMIVVSIAAREIVKAAKLVFEMGQRGKDIPVFWKFRKNEWEYRGRFLCIGMSMDKRIVAKRTKDNRKRVRIHGVLWFEQVG